MQVLEQRKVYGGGREIGFVPERYVPERGAPGWKELREPRVRVEDPIADEVDSSREGDEPQSHRLDVDVHSERKVHRRRLKAPAGLCGKHPLERPPAVKAGDGGGHRGGFGVTRRAEVRLPRRPSRGRRPRRGWQKGGRDRPAPPQRHSVLPRQGRDQARRPRRGWRKGWSNLPAPPHRRGALPPLRPDQARSTVPTSPAGVACAPLSRPIRPAGPTEGGVAAGSTVLTTLAGVACAPLSRPSRPAGPTEGGKRVRRPRWRWYRIIANRLRVGSQGVEQIVPRRVAGIE